MKEEEPMETEEKKQEVKEEKEEKMETDEKKEPEKEADKEEKEEKSDSRTTMNDMCFIWDLLHCQSPINLFLKSLVFILTICSTE